MNTPAAPETDSTARSKASRPARASERRLWYRTVRVFVSTFMAMIGGWRATGFRNMPETGGVLLVSNHLSHLDVILLGIGLRRPLNFVARSTLFFPPLGLLIRSLGAFPIQREGMGASGMKETLKRLRSGGVVTLFPEGTRSRDGELAPLKSGIAVLASRAGVPVVPAGIAGTFRTWPRGRLLPIARPLRVHYGPPIMPSDLEGLDSQAVTELIQSRIQECIETARLGLAGDMDAPSAARLSGAASGDSAALGVGSSA